jgi:hypothetical protein
MPQFISQFAGEDTLFVDTSSGIATYRGVSYHHSCTLETANGEPSMKPIPPDLFISIDFSRVLKVDIITTHLGDGEWLAIDLTAWNAVFLKRVPVAGTSVAGSKRCMC